MTSAGRRQGWSIRSQTLIERAERRSGRHCSLRNLLEPKTVDPRPVKMVHRAASACHVKDASSCWLVYLVFEPTARKRSEYLADLTHLRDVLGSRSSLGIALAECSIEQSRSLIELRRR